MLEIVISGGQSGADVCGWRVAKRHGIPTGGWMPAQFLTEQGPRPAYAVLFGARELVGGDYPQRTRRNVQDADAVVWYGTGWSAGARCTFNAARAMGKPVYIVGDPGAADPPMVATWVAGQAPTVLMIAGNRASKATIRDDQIEKHLEAVFAMLGFPPIEGAGD